MHPDSWMYIAIGAAICTIAICICIYETTAAEAEALQTKAAMENGYEEVIEDGKRLWKKIDDQN